MEIVALESSLIKGMVEVLPAPGTAMTVARRSEWLDMMGRSLGLVYPEVAAVALPAPALRHPQDDEEIALLEARPRAPKVETAFGERLQGRKGASGAGHKEVSAPRPKAERPKATAAPVNVVPADVRAGKPRARDVILAVLQASGEPMTLKAMVASAEKMFKGHGFKNIKGAMDFQLKGMEGHEVGWEFGDKGKEWSLLREG